MSCLEQKFTIQCPANVLIVGPTSCGKTTFLKRLLLDNRDVFSISPTRVYYCYGSWQPSFDEMKSHGVKFFPAFLKRKTLLNGLAMKKAVCWSWTISCRKEELI